jgi:2-dehydro-3-deoxyphosphooctonate aldolase (KDO 8-P synthase)
MIMTKITKVGNLKFANDLPINFIAGPCVIESEKSFLQVARKLKSLFKSCGKKFVLKASFDKANRTSISSFRGIGLVRAIKLLRDIKKELNVPILVDVHEPYQAEIIAQSADILQIPAFLCRQTDLIIACAETKKTINVKKGQFLSPQHMVNIIEKIESTGNKSILLTERGTSFGYGDLVVDMRSLEIMKQTGYPVIFDCTHSVQKPGSLGTTTGGDRRFIMPLAKAATAIGIAGLFFETHPNPAKALSDGANSLDLKSV